MKLLGIVILYNPTDSIYNNILSYLPLVDQLIVWYNSPHNDDFLSPLGQKSRIIEMGNGCNVGIGVALNVAIDFARKYEYTHLLTMDQDSYFVRNDFSMYLKAIKESNIRSIFSPNYLLHDKALYTSIDDGFIEVETTMTSGSVYPVEVFSKIGLFRDDFFIDAIDTEFSLRAKKSGITTRVMPQVCLVHGAGYQKTKHKFLWKTFFPNEYSPVRSYYIVRNGIITKRLYPWANWKGFLYYWFYKRLFFVICYEDNKFAKIKGLLYGFYHGMIGKTGEQTIF